jgi:glycosyltransferase involved in cell wall biosynthesis
MPLLSIITVCKNPGKLIHSTVESIKSQNFENFEYIVVDSLSTDGTREYLLKIKVLSLLN